MHSRSQIASRQTKSGLSRPGGSPLASRNENGVAFDSGARPAAAQCVLAATVMVCSTRFLDAVTRPGSLVAGCALSISTLEVAI